MKPEAAAHAQRRTGLSSATTPRRAAGALCVVWVVQAADRLRPVLGGRERHAGRVQRRCQASGDGRYCRTAA